MTALELMEMFEEVCGSSPTNGQVRTKRRTKAEIAELKSLIYSVVKEDPPMTVRQVFYQLVSRGAIDKTENEYKNVVVRLLGIMRRENALPWEWIADNTRWMRKPATYSGLRSMLEQAAQTYRRSLWDDQDAHVEIWLEKEALAGVVYRITEQWDVPLMVTRGYPSLSFVYSAAEAIQAHDKPTHLYYFGDHDPSGKDIPRSIEKNIRDMAPNADFTFELVAVTELQIEAMDLPTRPTKTKDSRAKNFKGESTELDAIPAADLRAMVAQCIEQHVDGHALIETERIEALERETLEHFLESVEDAT